MRIIEANGAALHVADSGPARGTPDGPALVFANSLGTDLRLWDALIPHLPDGLRLVRYDKRGHGLSEETPGPYSIEQLADDAAGLIEALGLRDVVFVGLSIGGLIGQSLAARHPGTLAGLVISNSAAKIGEAYGYDEINLNVGCPSDRVQSGRFGACLMREPELVADCMAAIREAVTVPATVKCRIGVDDQDPTVSLFATVDACAAVGIEVFVVHARKAWLKGEADLEALLLRPLGFYAEQDIDFRPGVQAVSVDPAARRVGFHDGTEETYDVLVLATGSTARKLPVPGGDHPDLLELRTLHDAERLKAVRTEQARAA